MLQITSIKNGFVLDHIEAGLGIKIFYHLNLDKEENQVALIMNATSKTLGKKDIIKLEDVNDLDYTKLALIAPTITINKVIDGKLEEKIKPTLPRRVENKIVCNNTRCITTVEKYVPQVFVLVNEARATYRCEYCDHITTLREV